MQEILRHLPPEARVLDLGSRAGSFDRASFPFLTIQVDIEPAAGLAGANIVRADAAELPFREECFDAIICNHSLEHFERLDGALREMGRVAKSEAALYVAVPDATTVTDRLYRWLARGGGHVNAFASADELRRRIEVLTGLTHVATRLLFTSLSFMNAKNRVAPAPRKMWLFAGGAEAALAPLNALLRWMDRSFRTRASVYGWALFFGNIRETVDLRPWVNACMRCGSSHPAESLLAGGNVWRRYGLFRAYRCPHCNAANPFFADDPRDCRDG